MYDISHNFPNELVCANNSQRILARHLWEKSVAVHSSAGNLVPQHFSVTWCWILNAYAGLTAAACRARVLYDPALKSGNIYKAGISCSPLHYDSAKIPYESLSSQLATIWGTWLANLKEVHMQVRQIK